jgi:hypothetical protein
MLFSEIWPGPVQKSIIHSIEILINSIEVIEIYFLTGFHDPAIYLNMIFPFKSADTSNKVGNISVLKKFVISSFPAPKSPVVLSAINLNS